MKFYYCSGFICLLMNMNVASLFPTLPASLSWGASQFHGSPSFPCLASPAGRAGWAAVTAAEPGDSWWEGVLEQTWPLACGHWSSLGSGLRFSSLDEESSGMGVYALLSGWPWTLGMSEWEVLVLQGQQQSPPVCLSWTEQEHQEHGY